MLEQIERNKSSKGTEEFVASGRLRIIFKDAMPPRATQKHKRPSAGAGLGTDWKSDLLPLDKK